MLEPPAKVSANSLRKKKHTTEEEAPYCHDNHKETNNDINDSRVTELTLPNAMFPVSPPQEIAGRIKGNTIKASCWFLRPAISWDHGGIGGWDTLRFPCTFHGFTLALSLWHVLLFLVLASIFLDRRCVSQSAQKDHTYVCLYNCWAFGWNHSIIAWVISSKSCLEFVFQAHLRCPFMSFPRLFPQALGQKGFSHTTVWAPEKSPTKDVPGKHHKCVRI